MRSRAELFASNGPHLRSAGVGPGENRAGKAKRESRNYKTEKRKGVKSARAGEGRPATWEARRRPGFGEPGGQGKARGTYPGLGRHEAAARSDPNRVEAALVPRNTRLGHYGIKDGVIKLWRRGTPDLHRPGVATGCYLLGRDRRAGREARLFRQSLGFEFTPRIVETAESALPMGSEVAEPFCAKAVWRRGDKGGVTCSDGGGLCSVWSTPNGVRSTEYPLSSASRGRLGAWASDREREAGEGEAGAGMDKELEKAPSIAGPLFDDGIVGPVWAPSRRQSGRRRGHRRAMPSGQEAGGG